MTETWHTSQLMSEDIELEWPAPLPACTAFLGGAAGGGGGGRICVVAVSLEWRARV